MMDDRTAVCRVQKALDLTRPAGCEVETFFRFTERRTLVAGTYNPKEVLGEISKDKK